MFTFSSRFRRQVAVLMVLSLVASVLVVGAPASAADDPKADYTATFDACMSAPSAGFTDVAEGHANAGDIDCIAYYGITKGTSATTYSPLMSVTREHMALFLTRLAALVGIEMAANPSDPGFTDDDDLSAESQTAIAQLADLGITRGSSDTTYSPAANVTRGHMALFIQRLMNLITPMAKDKDTPYGHKPSQVVAVAADATATPPVTEIKIGSPFTDLGSATKDEYDAVTQLWELGVASGISDTSYAHASEITRAAMAGFMAALLDHSNARPAGLSIQATGTEDYGDVEGDIVVSYRSETFAPMQDVSVTIFNTGTTDVLPFDEDGKCAVTTNCDWSEDEDLTNAAGNIYVDGEADVSDTNGKVEVTYYAWMGDEDNKDFVKGSSGEVMVTYTAKPNALGIRITADINENATDYSVDLDVDSTVVLTAQLIDNAGADAATLTAAKAVPKAGVEISISESRGGTVLFPAPAAMKTDDKGQVMFTLTGPKGTDDNDDRDDIVTFTGDVDGDTTDTASPDNEERAITVKWLDDDAALANNAKGTAPTYVIVDDGKVSVKATASFFDQYGNPAGQGGTLTITIGSNDAVTRKVKSNGTASATGSVTITGALTAATDNTISIAFSGLTTDPSNNITAPSADDVYVVRHAHKNDTAPLTEVKLYADDDRYRKGAVLFSYDSDDTFIIDGLSVDMETFEAKLDALGSDANDTVEAVVYRPDGVSIFSYSTVG